MAPDPLIAAARRADASVRPLTMPGLLEHQARVNPEFICLLADGRSPIGYGDLYDAVGSLAARLRELGVTAGDRIAIALPGGPEIASAFLAVTSCAAAVPLNPAYRKNEFASYFDTLGVTLLLSTCDSPAAAAAGEKGIPVLEAVADPGHPAGVFALRGETGRMPSRGRRPEPGDTALLLHTSGTTGRHKTVPLTHANVCSAAASIVDAVALTAGDRCLNVMPLQYIHGLSALLATMTAGGSIVCTPGFSESKFFPWVASYHPTWYTASPTIHRAVLDGAAAHPAIAGAKPFRFIRSASAPMPPQLIRDLERVFDCPFLEAYGMTETAPQVASNRFDPPERRAGSVGKAAGPDVAIMDQEGAILPAGSVGEVVVRGPNVMSGYENNAAANAAAFTGGWFRTGDLGRLDEDGYLFITGRLKEMINRGGEKVFPREIDEILLDHPAVAEAATFAVPHPRLGEDVAAAVRLRPGARADEDALRDFVAARVADFKVPRRVIVVAEIPKSTAGKIQRGTLAARLGVTAEAPAAGVGPVPPRDAYEWRLLKIWENVLRRGGLGIRDNFFEAGGYSVLAVSLFEEIEKMTGKSLPLATLFHAPTIEKLAAVIRQEGWRPPWSTLVPIQPAGANPPLYCAHGGGGNVLSFEALARCLGSDQPLYGLQSVGLDGESPLESVEEMAERYLKDILDFQPEGPYFLEGMSFGGLVAFEMARELERRGKEVGMLALLDTYPKGVQKSLSRESALRKVELRMSEFLALPLHAKGVFLAHRREEYLRKIGSFVRRRPAGVESTTARRVRTVRETNLLASLKYEPRPYHGAVTVFWARESFVNSTYRFRRGWDLLAPDDLELIVVPGSHTTMFEEPNVRALAAELARRIRVATSA